MSPQTVLLEPAREVPPEHVPWVQALIAACRFTPATQGNLGGAPVTESPHSYVRRDRLPESVRTDFDRFADLIDGGYRGRFLGTVYTYLDVGDHRYWISPSAFAPVTVILNRASAGTPAPTPPPTLWPEEPS